MWQITRRITQQDLGSERVNSLILFTNLWRNKWESGRRILEWIASVNQKSKLERYKQTNKHSTLLPSFCSWSGHVGFTLPFLSCSTHFLLWLFLEFRLWPLFALLVASIWVISWFHWCLVETPNRTSSSSSKFGVLAIESLKLLASLKSLPSCKKGQMACEL